MAQADPVRLAVMIGFAGASLFAFYGGYRAVVGSHTEAPPPPIAVQSGTPVLTASGPIARGEEIVPSKLRAITVEGAAPDGSFAAPEALVGKVALTDIVPGQILLPGMVSADPGEGGLAMLIPPGKRAIAIPIAEDVAVSNMVRAGDLVDVLLVLRAGVLPHGSLSGPTGPGGASGGPLEPGDASETRVLLQAVPVLTVGEHISHARTAPVAEPASLAPPPTRLEPLRTLTLALTPAQAQTLALGRTLGALHLALRNPRDLDLTRHEPVTLQELRGAALQAEPMAAADPRRPIELIVGNEHRTIYSLDAAAPGAQAAQAQARPPRVLAP